MKLTSWNQQTFSFILVCFLWSDFFTENSNLFSPRICTLLRDWDIRPVFSACFLSMNGTLSCSSMNTVLNCVTSLMGSFFGPLQNLFWFLITRKLTKMQTFYSRKNSMKMLATLRLTFVRFPAKYNVFSWPQLVVFLLRKGNEKLSRSNVFFSTRVNGFLERGPSRHPGTLETVFSELSSGFCSPFVFFEDFTEYFPETMG